MKIVLEIIVCFIAGMGAGLGTGFAGMSAAAVISPMLITFLGMPAYQAVGIALASDVLASAASAYTYGKNKNLDIRNGLIMMAAVLVMTMVGSWMASLMPDSTMGSFSVIMTFLLGVKFIAKPVMTTKEIMNGVSKRVRVIQSVVCATYSEKVLCPKGITSRTPLCGNVMQPARLAKEKGTLIELNGKRINFTDQELEIMASEGVKFIVNSDAHSPDKVGECNNALDTIFRLGLPISQIVNIDKLPKFGSKR